ncbi:hypothetical protein E2562_034008 [Oryza meyeriana var. granulata]|uniref:Uncharacterized protein n=1 Tax=Oryza meyeriana var. granulata TaxID=110450 RepID=A0A6G1ESD9_9ORYZ|nr:hypothetical protein E2562_034008 [Oryza meyeriana var. granulata]
MSSLAAGAGGTPCPTHRKNPCPANALATCLATSPRGADDISTVGMTPTPPPPPAPRDTAAGAGAATVSCLAGVVAEGTTMSYVTGNASPEWKAWSLGSSKLLRRR